MSRARLDANRRNAKKSTGPRSKEGKRRSSMNALKHGMTAQLAILPDENPAAFERRMAEWVGQARPRNVFELIRAERAAYCSWQLERAQRAQSARLCFKAHTDLDDGLDREEQEVKSLARSAFSESGRRAIWRGSCHAGAGWRRDAG